MWFSYTISDMSLNKTVIRDDLTVGEVRVARLENDHLRVDVSPETGGRIISLYNKSLEQAFLWKNERLSLCRLQPGDPYDPNFYGGIDEVIPGDMPEQIGALENPDHGELWTLPLAYHIEDNSLVLEGLLPVWKLKYRKRLSLRPDSPWMDVDYRIENDSGEQRIFLWKLHAALTIAEGDQIRCPAQMAVVADPEWSRWKTETPFAWPLVEGQRTDQIPSANGTTDFLFLYNLNSGQISLRRPSQGSEFAIVFDRSVFPYVCYFASYGGLYGHYTAVLEPCTAMPVSVNEAAGRGQCSVLDAGGCLETRVSLYGGHLIGI
jgi:hypothetical protein